MCTRTMRLSALAALRRDREHLGMLVFIPYALFSSVYLSASIFYFYFLSTVIFTFSSEFLRFSPVYTSLLFRSLPPPPQSTLADITTRAYFLILSYISIFPLHFPLFLFTFCRFPALPSKWPGLINSFFREKICIGSSIGTSFFQFSLNIFVL